MKKMLILGFIGLLMASRGLLADKYYNELTISADTTETENVFIGHESATSGSADNALVTVKSGAIWDAQNSVVMGYNGAFSRFVVENGGVFSNMQSGTTFQLGRGYNKAYNYSIITNKGLFEVNSLRFGWDNYDGGSSQDYKARFDNFGTLVVNRGLSLGARKHKNSAVASVLYNHPGATLTVRRAGNTEDTGGTYGFYLGDRAPGCITNAGTIISLDEGHLRLGGAQSTALGSLVMVGDGKYEAGDYAHVGFRKGSTGILEMSDNSEFDGVKNGTKCFVGAGNVSGWSSFTGAATGKIMMSDNAEFATEELVLGKGPGSTALITVEDDARLKANSLVFCEGADTKATVTLKGNATITVSSGNLEVAKGEGAEGRVELVDYLKDGFDMNVRLGMGNGASGFLALGGSTMLSYDKINSVSMGYVAGSTGGIELQGDSKLTVSGNFNVNGYVENSTGTVSVVENARLVVSNVLHIGSVTDKPGIVKVLDDACVVVSNICVAYPGKSSSRMRGVLEVADNAVITNLMAISLGRGQTALGVLKMSGGSVFLDYRRWSGNPVVLGSNGGYTDGVIRGYGYLGFDDPKKAMVDYEDELGLKSWAGMTFCGQIIADGGILDFSRGPVASWMPTSYNGCNTNGFYAVNKGLLKLQRSLPRLASHKAVGVKPDEATAIMVNSFNYTFDSAIMAKTGTYMFSELYAVDRDDIPAGLPSGDGRVVSAVWRIGHFNETATPDVDDTALNNTHKQNYENLELKFHYDPNLAEVDGAYRIRVYRCTDSVKGGWQRIGGAVPDASSPYVTTREFTPSSELWNVGWFAIVAEPKKCTAIIVR